MDQLDTLLDTLFDLLAVLLGRPHTAAAVVGIGCAFGFRDPRAFAGSVAVAGGLLCAGHPWLGVLVGGTLIAAWLFDCRRWPTRDCLRCSGVGGWKRTALGWVTFRECGCDGGRKRRLGARLLTAVFGPGAVKG